MIIRATARIVPGNLKKVRRRDAKHVVTHVDGSTANRVEMRSVKKPIVDKTNWNPDKENRGKGVVTLCISMPPQMFTDLHLFARSMRMNHSHLLRVALSEMMSRNGWKERTDGETP